MEALNFIREYVSGFRMPPSLAKLWYGQDEGDAVDNSRSGSILLQVEYYLVKVQELALWTDPKSSAIALGVVHLFFAYLAATSNTSFNLVLWTILFGFLYITWTQRIWPEIRVDAKPMLPIDYTNPEVFSASELQDIIIVISGKSKRGYKYLVEMRRETPGKFCFAMCTCLSIVAYLGSFVSSFCLFYYLTVGGLIVPGSLKYIIRNYPDAQELFVNLRIMEEVKCEKAKGKNKKHGDEVDGSMVAGMVGDMRGAADKVQSIVQNVCSTLQTGVSSLASTLPDMQQLEKEQKELKGGGIVHSSNDQVIGDEGGAALIDDLAPYLPDVNSIESSQILETCVREFELGPKHPTEVESFDNVVDDNPASLLDCSIAGLDRSIMPDHDELDSLPAIHAPASGNILEDHYSGNVINRSIILRSATPEDEVDELDKEFLPVINVVSSEKRTTSSNISNDEFDLEEDSRQLSIDQSYPASHHSDIGEDCIPYDGHELEVQAAMQELIDEEENERAPVKSIMDDKDVDPILLPHDTDTKLDEEETKQGKKKIKDASEESSIDLEEDFELISADELSLPEDA